MDQKDGEPLGAGLDHQPLDALVEIVKPMADDRLAGEHGVALGFEQGQTL